MSGKYEGGTAVYDVIREALRNGQPRTVAALSKITGYSEGYVRQWLGKMPDVIKVYTRPALRYRINSGNLPGEDQ